MKILSINNFTIKLLIKLLSDLSIGVHLKCKAYSLKPVLLNGLAIYGPEN